MHAPQPPSPHPSFVPVSPFSARPTKRYQPGLQYAEGQHLSLPLTALGRGGDAAPSLQEGRSKAGPSGSAALPGCHRPCGRFSCPLAWCSTSRRFLTPLPAAPRPRPPAHRAGRPTASAPPRSRGRRCSLPLTYSRGCTSSGTASRSCATMAPPRRPRARPAGPPPSSRVLSARSGVVNGGRGGEGGGGAQQWRPRPGVRREPKLTATCSAHVHPARARVGPVRHPPPQQAPAILTQHRPAHVHPARARYFRRPAASIWLPPSCGGVAAGCWRDLRCRLRRKCLPPVPSTACSGAGGGHAHVRGGPALTSNPAASVGSCPTQSGRQTYK